MIDQLSLPGGSTPNTCTVPDSVRSAAWMLPPTSPNDLSSPVRQTAWRNGGRTPGILLVPIL